MAYATVAGRRYNVRVVRDLTENWSLEVYPVPDQGKLKTFEPFKNWPVPLCMKLRADSREDALSMGLEQMKKQGRIDDFHLESDERPQPPQKPGSSQKAPESDEA
jgi:hypothetical protein